MENLINFLNNKNETVTILINITYSGLLNLLSDYCNFSYDNLSDSQIRIKKHNNNNVFELHETPMLGSIYVEDNLYLLKKVDILQNDKSLKLFMNIFHNKPISEELFNFLEVLNTSDSLSILSDNKYAMNAIENNPGIKIKKVCNCYVLYKSHESKLLILGLINMIHKCYYVLNLMAYDNTDVMKIIGKYRNNKCSNKCKNYINPFCFNDHGNQNYLYCKNQIRYLKEFGLYDLIVNRFTCNDCNCQGYHLFRVSSPIHMSEIIKKSV